MVVRTEMEKGKVKGSETERMMIRKGEGVKAIDWYQSIIAHICIDVTIREVKKAL